MKAGLLEASRHPRRRTRPTGGSAAARDRAQVHGPPPPRGPAGPRATSTGRCPILTTEAVHDTGVARPPGGDRAPPGRRSSRAAPWSDGDRLAGRASCARSSWPSCARRWTGRSRTGARSSGCWPTSRRAGSIRTRRSGRSPRSSGSAADPRRERGRARRALTLVETAWCNSSGVSPYRGSGPLPTFRSATPSGTSRPGRSSSFTRSDRRDRRIRARHVAAHRALAGREERGAARSHSRADPLPRAARAAPGPDPDTAVPGRDARPDVLGLLRPPAGDHPRDHRLRHHAEARRSASTSSSSRARSISFYELSLDLFGLFFVLGWASRSTAASSCARRASTRLRSSRGSSRSSSSST